MPSLSRSSHTKHWRRFCLATLIAAVTGSFQILAQTTPVAKAKYKVPPSLDLEVMDRSADPCSDFYAFACGNYAARNPIPSDQTGTNNFHTVYNVVTEELSGILTRYSTGGSERTPNQQKIGDYYAACMNTSVIEQKGLSPIEPILRQIDGVSKADLPSLTGELQRYGANVFFRFGKTQDLKDSSKQVAFVAQGGLGLRERGFYLRTGERDRQIRDQYVAHIAAMLTLTGEDPKEAASEAGNILVFETKLADASLPASDLRDPETVYHPQSLSFFRTSIEPFAFDSFLSAAHAPSVLTVLNRTPQYFPALIQTIDATDIRTLRAYLKYQFLSAVASDLPKRLDEENFDFYLRKLVGQSEQQPRWKRCSSAVDDALGEALGQVWVKEYFPPESKRDTLQIVEDVEGAMDQDLDSLDWMSAATKARAREKLHAVTNKIGYPDHWRDYTKLVVSPTDYVGNDLRATAFESDRQLAMIGQPVDKLEWALTAPTADAFQDVSNNSTNFPAGILQQPFFDPKADLAENYGHIGAIIGHELTHTFDDQGRQFDAKGNFADWWTAEDAKAFEAKTSCLVNEYDSFTVSDGVKVNGKFTLGENTADNGGLLLAYLAYMNRVQKEHLNPDEAIDGYTGPQRFFISYAQNWCENARPEATRDRVLTDPHAPNSLRVNGVIVNQPGFGPAFACKQNSPMIHANTCRVW